MDNVSHFLRPLAAQSTSCKRPCSVLKHSRHIRGLSDCENVWNVNDKLAVLSDSRNARV